MMPDNSLMLMYFIHLVRHELAVLFTSACPIEGNSTSPVADTGKSGFRSTHELEKV